MDENAAESTMDFINTNDDGARHSISSVVALRAFGSSPDAIRSVQYNGASHLVVPAVLMTEGVHHGSNGPIFYPAEELSKFPEAWNGIPIPVYHPCDNGGNPTFCNQPDLIAERIIGRVFNVRYRDRKLLGELWIDEAKARSISPETLQRLQDGKLEVSTGLFSDEDATPGTWNGEEYQKIARNFRPDHLAVLPNGRGACSWEDGCGAPRVNAEAGARQGGENVTDINKVKDAFKSLFGKLAPMLGFSANEMSFDDIRGKLQRAVDAFDSDTKLHIVLEAYPDYFVYESFPGSQAAPGTERKTYKRSYTVDEASGTVALSDDVQEVIAEMTYRPVENASSGATGNDPVPTQNNQNKQGEQTMADNAKVVALVSALIANAATLFTEDDRSWLEKMPEEQLGKMAPKETPAATPVANAAPDPKTAAQPAVLSAEDNEALEYGRRKIREEKEALIARISANSKAFTADELKAMTNEALGKIASLIPQPDYSLAAGGVGIAANSGEEPLGLPNYELNAARDQK